MSELNDLQSHLLAQVEQAQSLAMLDEMRVAILGKKGTLTAELKKLGAMDPQARKEFGQQINQIKQAVQDSLDRQFKILGRAELEARLIEERLDVSQPARPRQNGKIHPITQTIDEVVAIFGEMGFTWAEGPEIETDWYNFSAMNMPANHPIKSYVHNKIRQKLSMYIILCDTQTGH